jgi:hypothetical protein
MKGWLLGLLVIAGGCSKNEETAVRVTPPSAMQSLQLSLKELSEKGGPLGSAALSLKDDAERLRATDSTKADALMKGIDQLNGLSDQNKFKAKARELLDLVSK